MAGRWGYSSAKGRQQRAQAGGGSPPWRKQRSSPWTLCSACSTGWVYDSRLASMPHCQHCGAAFCQWPSPAEAAGGKLAGKGVGGGQGQQQPAAAGPDVFQEFARIVGLLAGAVPGGDGGKAEQLRALAKDLAAAATPPAPKVAHAAAAREFQQATSGSSSSATSKSSLKGGSGASGPSWNRRRPTWRRRRLALRAAKGD